MLFNGRPAETIEHSTAKFDFQFNVETSKQLFTKEVIDLKDNLMKMTTIIYTEYKKI